MNGLDWLKTMQAETRKLSSISGDLEKLSSAASILGYNGLAGKLLEISDHVHKIQCRIIKATNRKVDAERMVILYKSKMTSEQKYLLDKNPHLIPVSRLDDGDWLVLDSEGPKGQPGSIDLYGPYILTLDGKVQEVNYHFAKYHDVPVPY
jgi:hypothetical protein